MAVNPHTPMQIRLIVEKGSKTRSVYVVKGPDMVIGRQTGCHLRIPSGAVSRRHCLLTLVHDGLLVRDLGSANGTIVNGREIRGEQELRPGDRLQIGPVTFLVEFAQTPAGPRLAPEEMLPPGFEIIDEDSMTSSAQRQAPTSPGFDWSLLPDLDDWELDGGK